MKGNIFLNFLLLLLIYPVLAQGSISNYLAADYSELAKQAVQLTTDPSLLADKEGDYDIILKDAIYTPDSQSKIKIAKRCSVLGHHLKSDGYNPEIVNELVKENKIKELRKMAGIPEPLTKAERDERKKKYFDSDENLKDYLWKNHQMRPDSSGATEENKRYLTCTKIKPTNMTDRELMLLDDYKIDAVLSLSKLILLKDGSLAHLYSTLSQDGSPTHGLFPSSSSYFFSSRGIDVYRDGSKVLFVDRSKILNIIFFNSNSLSVQEASYKCEDPGIVKLLKMKAKY